jgi:hypothetical protein
LLGSLGGKVVDPACRCLSSTSKHPALPGSRGCVMRSVAAELSSWLQPVL